MNDDSFDVADPPGFFDQQLPGFFDWQLRDACLAVERMPGRDPRLVCESLSLRLVVGTALTKGLPRVRLYNLRCSKRAHRSGLLALGAVVTFVAMGVPLETVVLQLAIHDDSTVDLQLGLAVQSHPQP